MFFYGGGMNGLFILESRHDNLAPLCRHLPQF